MDVSFAITKVSESQAVAGLMVELNLTLQLRLKWKLNSSSRCPMDFTGKRTFAMNVNGEINEGYVLLNPH